MTRDVVRRATGMELPKVLGEDTGNLAHRFFAKSAQVVDTP